MKKIVVSIIMLIILLLGTINSYAETTGETKKIDLTVTGITKVEATTKTVTLKIKLGAFTGIAEQVSLGYETTLNYDASIFESVTVKGLNGWNAEYEPSTKKIIADVGKATSNTEITEIVLTLKEGVKPGTTKVSVSNLMLTDSVNDFTFNKEISITIEEKKEDNTINTVINNTVNNTTSNTNATIKGNNTDKTIANTKIPAAGVKNIIMIAITIILLAGIGSYIRYKTIKLK